MAVQSAASPLAAQAGATSTWTAPPSTCQTTTQTAAPATLTRRQTPTSSNRSSDRLFPHPTLFPNCVSPTPKVHMDSSQSTQKIRAMRDFYSSWAEHAWQPFFFFHPSHLQGKSTTLLKERLRSGVPQDKRTLLPYSVLLWQAASPGSSVSIISAS